MGLLDHFFRNVFEPRPSDSLRKTRDMLVAEGRAARRAGIHRDHPMGKFKDPDMRIDWANGWRWEDEDIRARAAKRSRA